MNSATLYKLYITWQLLSIVLTLVSLFFSPSTLYNVHKVPNWRCLHVCARDTSIGGRQNLPSPPYHRLVRSLLFRGISKSTKLLKIPTYYWIQPFSSQLNSWLSLCHYISTKVRPKAIVTVVPLNFHEFDFSCYIWKITVKKLCSKSAQKKQIRKNWLKLIYNKTMLRVRTPQWIWMHYAVSMQLSNPPVVWK